MQKLQNDLAMHGMSWGPSRREFLRTTMMSGLGLAAAVSLSSGATAQTPKRGGFLQAGLASGATTDTLDPGLLEAGFLIPLGTAINGYLTEIDADNKVQPSLAESWEVSSDARVWRFRLRKDVTFHNGRAVTPEDVIASMNYHRGEASTSAAKPLMSAITGLKSDGPNTVVFELDSGNADFPAALADYHLAILPVTSGEIDWRSGTGCGAYILEQFDPGVSAELARNPNHWTDAVGYVDEWRLLALIDSNARTTALLSGDVDVIDRIDPRTASLLKRDQSVSVHSVAGTQHYTFPMRVDAGPFMDNNIRQAIKWAIDRQVLVDRVLLGYGSVGNDHPISPSQRFFNTDIEQKQFDPDRARSFLRKAGADSLNVQLSASDAAFPGAVDAALLISDACGKCGINVEVVREPGDGYWSNVWRNKPWCASYMAGRPVEDLTLSLSYKTGVAWNESFWSNKHFDTLLDAARVELDETARRKMYFEMQNIVANQGGVAVPMFADYIFATRGNVVPSSKFGSNLDMDGARFIERWSVA